MQQEKQILDKLERIEKSVEDIKNHMVDIDSIMTEEDYQALVQYRKEKSQNKLISHQELKKELGL